MEGTDTGLTKIFVWESIAWVVRENSGVPPKRVRFVFATLHENVSGFWVLPLAVKLGMVRVWL